MARLLSNPVPGTEEVTAFSRALSLVWQPSQPAHLVSRYNVYISGDSITDVTNLTPAGSTREARFTRYDLEPERT